MLLGGVATMGTAAPAAPRAGSRGPRCLLPSSAAMDLTEVWVRRAARGLTRLAMITPPSQNQVSPLGADGR